MKSLMFIIFFLLNVSAQAQTTPNTQTYFEFLNSPVNTVRNPHARLNVINTAVGGSASRGRASGSDELGGLASHTCSLSAINSYCELALKPAVAPYNSPNARCEASIWYNGVNTNLVALSYTPTGGSEILVPLKSVTGTEYASGYTELACSSGTGVWRLKQITAGTTGTIKYGGYYGPSTRTGKQSDTNTFSAKISETGVITDQTPRAWLTSCSIPGNDASCTFVASTFATAPNCTANVNSAMFGTPTGARTFSITASGFGYNTTVNNSGTQVKTPTIVTCTKTDPASQYTVATVDNFDTKPYPCTPTFTGLGTVTGVDFLCWNRGFERRIKGTVTAGTPTAVSASMTLPNGWLLDQTGLLATAQRTKVGDWWAAQATSQNTPGVNSGPFVLWAQTSVSTSTIQFSLGTANTANTFVSVTGSGMAAAGYVFQLDVTVPIVGGQPAASGLINIDVPVYTVTRLTSGSGTYTPPAGVKWLEVEQCGAGGGGGGGNGTATPGGNGTATTFGTSLLTASGGSGIATASTTVIGGAGGTATVSGSAIPVLIVNGGFGQAGSVGIANAPGGNGGSSYFGGGGAGAAGGGASSSQTICGGGGGGSVTVGGLNTGHGGGAGGYLKAIVPTPTGTYPYAVGVGGAAGTAGANGYSGSSGGRGEIIIKEHYTNFTPALASGLLQRLPGAVTTNGSSPERIERITFGGASAVSNCTSSPCTIEAQSSLTSTVARTGTGVYTMTFTNPWTSKPTCTCTAITIGSKGALCYSAPTTTAANTNVENPSTGPLVDGFVQLICSGPR